MHLLYYVYISQSASIKNFNIYQDRILDTVGMGIFFG